MLTSSYFFYLGVHQNTTCDAVKEESLIHLTIDVITEHNYSSAQPVTINTDVSVSDLL